MKRIGYLYDKIIDIDNLYLAERNARKGKRSKKEVIDFVRDLHDNIFQLHWQLKNNCYKVGRYYHFTIFEPKPRNISKLPYRDRVLHHAIIQVLSPIFIKTFIPQTYSCIKNRGIHRALYNLRKYLRDEESTKFCLKLDVKQFYPSINNSILKDLLSHKFKDKRLLNLLNMIIDSIKGQPLGSYSSQFFANFYLTDFGKWLLEEKKIKYISIYCDDIVILGNDKNKLHFLRKDIEKYLDLHLNLKLSNFQVFPISKRGIDYLGYKIFHTHLYLRKSIKKRWIKMLKSSRNKESIVSYNGWLKWANCVNLKNKYLSNELTNTHI